MRIDLDVASRGSDSVRRYSFDLASIRIGRGDDCELALPSDLLLGRRQCSLEWHAGTLFLFPLRGTGETLLNSTRVQRPLPLSAGDIIEVGSQVIKVLFVPPELSYPSGAPRRLTLRVTEPGGSPRIVDTEAALLRLCQGTASDLYLGEAKPSKLVAQDPVEALLFWSAAGMPHLLVHKYSAKVERNGEPVFGVTALLEGDTLTLGGAQIEVREIVSPVEPPPPPLGLLIFDGDAAPRWQFFPRSRVEVGSDKHADLQLQSPGQPSHGFAIERRGGRPMLLPGSAPVYLNFAKPPAAVELQHGDRIACGEALLHVDRQTPPPLKAVATEHRITLLLTSADEDPRELFLKGDSTRIGTTPQSTIEWPTDYELLVDLVVLWHPDGRPLLHVGMWSAEVMLDGQKLRRCTLTPLHVGARIEAAGTTAIVREIVPRPVTQPTS